MLPIRREQQGARKCEKTRSGQGALRRSLDDSGVQTVSSVDNKIILLQKSRSPERLLTRSGFRDFRKAEVPGCLFYSTAASA